MYFRTIERHCASSTFYFNVIDVINVHFCDDKIHLEIVTLFPVSNVCAIRNQIEFFEYKSNKEWYVATSVGRQKEKKFSPLGDEQGKCKRMKSYPIVQA